MEPEIQFRVDLGFSFLNIRLTCMVNKYWSNEEVSPLSHVGSYIFSLDQDLLGADADWIAP